MRCAETEKVGSSWGSGQHVVDQGVAKTGPRCRSRSSAAHTGIGEPVTDGKGDEGVESDASVNASTNGRSELSSPGR